MWKQLFFFFYPFSFLAAPWHMEFPGQGSEPSHSCDPYCSYNNARSFNPLCQARDRTCILVLQRQCRTHCATVGTPWAFFNEHTQCCLVCGWLNPWMQNLTFGGLTMQRVVTPNPLYYSRVNCTTVIPRLQIWITGLREGSNMQKTHSC